MFDAGSHPRLFGVAPGVDFPKALVAGIRTRLQGRPPHAMAQVQLIVNTRRMERRLSAVFNAGPPGFLPRIRVLSDLDGLVPGLDLPAPTPALKRRLELAQLVAHLLETDEGHIAPRASLYALTDSLASLMDEMQSEGVPMEAVTELDVADHSGHWDRAKRFLGIAHSYLDQLDTAPDAEARQRQVVERIVAHWAETPPEVPVIVAGSTGSRGTTSLLMQAVARLPQGALVLPGYDFAMPPACWALLDQDMPVEDHPQYRFHDLMQSLEVGPADIQPWADHPPPSAARNELVSLSLRPAPTTDMWLTEGPDLQDLQGATEGLTLIEAPSPRHEALAIALRLRKAVEEGRTAALITPDRMLTRQVTAALDRWNILPDDSAGTPLHLSPPGRFLCHVAGLLQRRLDAEALLTLLKHPLTHSTAERNQHQLNTQLFEMQLRRTGLPYPDAAGIRLIGEKAGKKLDKEQNVAAFATWVGWVADTFGELPVPLPQPLTCWVESFEALADRIAAGQDPAQPHALWDKKAGQKAQEVMETLKAQAEHGGEMSASDFADLIHGLLSAEEVRDRDAPHPQVMIWGTLEARVQGADLVILGGLNDGTWPEAPAPDPWLNRQMRLQAGMLLPERRIGLSAHDYQQAVAAPEVWLSRAIRSEEAETVPSRWLNRLDNLLNGLPGQGGPQAWDEMKQRGNDWLGQVQALEVVIPGDPAHRPSPRPPLPARFDALSVTEIKRLIRDPYAIYAKHTLRLRPMDPLVRTPDALVRGIVVHRIMEVFIKSVLEDPTRLTPDHLLETSGEILAADIPWPAARLMIQARMERVAEKFVADERLRQQQGRPTLFEKDAKGVHRYADLGFTLTGFADRIDLTEQGEVLIYDYKTGTPPSEKEQKSFDKQLLLEAAMVEEGGYEKIGAATVAEAAFVGLGRGAKVVPAPMDTEPAATVLAELRALVMAYRSPEQGFTSRRLVQKDAFEGDYDQLARFGEWDGTMASVPEVLK